MVLKNPFYIERKTFTIDWYLEKRFNSCKLDVNKKLDDINKELVEIKPKINQIYEIFFKYEQKENEQK